MSQVQNQGNMLRRLRGTKSQAEIASSIGITKSAWAMYERGERVPRDDTKVRIADFFNVSVLDLFYAQDEH